MSLDGKVPMLSCTLFTWQFLHDFILDRMVFIPFQYITDFSLSLRDGYAQGAEDSGDTT